jgi:pimeloyl-ACP methyl ester carboxylesterase
VGTPFVVRFDGAMIAGEADGFGLPVVFLHAGVADRRMWARQMEQCADAGYHSIAYDRRGFGETEAPDEPFSHLDDLEAVLDQLGIHAAVFVGCSMGGALAIDFAVANPNRTVGLVLVGTALSGAPEPEIEDEIEPLVTALEYAEDRGHLDSVNKIEAHLWLDGPLSPNGRVTGDVRDLILDMNGRALAKPKLTHEEEPDPVIDRLNLITAPVLLMVGDLDFPHIIERHAELEDTFENVFALTIEDTAHLPSLERPDLFDPLLLEFLDAVSGVADDDDE